MKKSFDIVTRAAGLVFVALLVFAIVNSESVADSGGRFYFLQSRSRVDVINSAEGAYMLRLMNRDGTVRASVDSAGAAVFAGTTNTGLTTVDSLKDKGIFNLNSTSNGTSTIYVKGLTGRAYVAKFVAPGTTTSLATIDTSGQYVAAVGSAASPTFSFTGSTGAGMYLSTSNVVGFATAGTLRVAVDAAGRLNVGNSSLTSAIFEVKNATNQANLAVFENSNGNERFKIDSSGAVHAASFLARLDSFVTTATVDTVLWAGARAGDAFYITGYTPAYSAVVDTVIYSYQIANDTVFVTRSKSYSANVSPAPAAVKSGGIYSLLGLRK